MTRDEFNEVYWAAQPPAVRALREMQNGPDKMNAAVALAQQGFTVDVFIGFYGFEPWGTMSGRQMQGLKWAPALLQDYHMVPNPINPGESGPDAPMPKGAIKTSVDPADYPPFDPPEPPNKPQLVKNPVGVQIPGTNIYAGDFGDNWPAGSQYTDERGAFVKKSQQTPFGPRMWWEKVA